MKLKSMIATTLITTTLLTSSAFTVNAIDFSKFGEPSPVHSQVQDFDFDDYVIEDTVKDFNTVEIPVPTSIQRPDVVKAPVVTEEISFADVPESHWAYNAIMTMAKAGIINGKTPLVNGVGTFDPEGTITYSEVFAISARLFATEHIVKRERTYYHWSLDYVYALVDEGNEHGFGIDLEQPTSSHIFNVGANPFFDYSSQVFVDGKSIPYYIYYMDGNISRYDMAEMLVPLALLRDEQLMELPNIAYNIGDYITINHPENIEKVYSNGLIGGMDDKGTFNPKGTLTRAEASIIFCRLMNYLPRLEVTVKAELTEDGQVIPYDKDKTVVNADGTITIYEGQISERRPAKEGDIFIKADGTQVVIKNGPHGIPAEGQCIAPDLGMTIEGHPVRQSQKYNVGTAIKTACGDCINNQYYYVNQFTGQGYWSSDDATIPDTEPTYDGEFSLQLSADKQWLWLEQTQHWTPADTSVLSDEALQKIIEANKLGPTQVFTNGWYTLS